MKSPSVKKRVNKRDRSESQKPSATITVTNAKRPKSSARTFRTSPADRAKIRILDQHGIPYSVISAMLNRCTQTIANILNGKGGLQEKYSDDDYNYVDEEFKAKFPQALISSRAINQTQPPPAIKRSDSHPPSLNITTKSPTRTPPRRRTRNKENLQTASEGNRDMKLSPTKHNESISSTGRYPEPLDVTSDEGSNLSETTLVPGSVAEFLSTLAHDISWAHKDLEEIDFGTMDKLLAIADWPKEDLHTMFREALPGLCVPQRFMLVRGLKIKYEEILNEAEMSPHVI